MTTFSPRTVEPRAFRRWAKDAAWLILHRPVRSTLIALVLGAGSVALQFLGSHMAAFDSVPSILSLLLICVGFYGLVAILVTAATILAPTIDPIRDSEPPGANAVPVTMQSLILASSWFVGAYLVLAVVEMLQTDDLRLLRDLLSSPAITVVVTTMGLLAPAGMWPGFVSMRLRSGIRDCTALVSRGLALNPRMHASIMGLAYFTSIPMTIAARSLEPSLLGFIVGPYILFVATWTYCGYCDVFEHRTPKPKLASALAPRLASAHSS